MNGFQKFIACGCIDGEVKSFNIGSTTKASFRVSVPRSYTDKDGNEKSATDRIDVTAWGKQAERVSMMPSGAWLYFEGAWRVEGYEKDGKKVWKTFINASDLSPMSRTAQEVEPY